MVCVLNEDGTYYGKISYQTYLSGKDQDMIDKTKVVLDQDIFKHAKQYFRQHWSEYYKTDLLPLVSEDGFLISTCYYDANMNEVVRKCRELGELDHVVGLFAEEIRQIIIYGCNEAAVGVYHLLKKNGYNVVVEGEQWENLGINGDQKSTEIPDYGTYHLYAEGNRADGRYRADIYELLNYHVSCQFQFIIDNYEKEPLLPKIEPWERMEKKLRETERPIILLGFEDYDCNFLKKRGINITAVRLVGKDEYWQGEKFLWYGIRVLTAENIKRQFPDAFYIIPHQEYITYQETALDTLESEGYYRNQQVLCLSDYMDEPEKSIAELIKNQKVILTGEKYLCDMAARYLEKDWNIDGKNVFFLDLETKENIDSDLQEIGEDECKQYKDAIYFVVVEYYAWIVCGKEMWQGNHYAKLLLQRGITNINPYFWKNLEYFQVDNKSEWKKVESDYKLKITGGKKVIYALIPGSSGNILINELLDGHPEILFIGESSNFRKKLLEHACHLAKIKSFDDKEKVLRGFLENQVKFDIEKFFFSFKKVLEPYLEPEAKEILVAFYIAYCNVSRDEDIKEEFAIYFEPHNCYAMKHRSNIQWFRENGFDVKILGIERNSVQKAGSVIKSRVDGGYREYKCIFGFSELDVYDDAFIIRFEDLKKNVEWAMRKFCEYAGIEYLELLLKTTFEGNKGEGYKGVMGLDLKPVYNMYEEYFSEFDRFRIRLINFLRQKALGYEYVDPSDFTAEEIEEMISCPFRFEESIEFTSEDARKEYMYRRKRGMEYYLKLQKERTDYYNKMEKILSIFGC